MKNEIVSIETADVLPPQTIEVLQRAEIDMQIATAKRYPRSIAQFKASATEIVGMDEETAESCIYRRPVGGGKTAEGMSIRMAEIVGACYGNLRYGAMLVEQTERQVKARGFCHDVQNNVASQVEVVEATIKKDGTPYDERMRTVIAKACLSKATRDAIFKVVPRAMCKSLEDVAKQVALGNADSFQDRRDKAMQWLTKIGIDAPRAFAALGIRGLDDMTTDHLVTLTGYKTAIKDGEITVEEAFPPLRKESPFTAIKKEDPAITSLFALMESNSVAEKEILKAASVFQIGNGKKPLAQWDEKDVALLIEKFDDVLIEINESKGGAE